MALIVLLPLSVRQLVQHKEKIRVNYKLILALGLTGIAAFHICVYIALTQTTAINALIILSVSPMVIVLISLVMFKEEVTWLQGIGILISLFGALILICHGNIETLIYFKYNRGDMWMVLAVLLWSVYSILLRKKPADIPQLVLLTSSVIVGIILMVPLYLYTLHDGQTLSLDINNTLAILYISIFASVLAFFFWNKGVTSIGPVKAGMYIHFMPFFGTVLSVWLLNEVLTMFHLIGVLLVGTGILLTNKQRRT